MARRAVKYAAVIIGYGLIAWAKTIDGDTLNWLAHTRKPESWRTLLVAQDIAGMGAVRRPGYRHARTSQERAYGSCGDRRSSGSARFRRLASYSRPGSASAGISTSLALSPTTSWSAYPASVHTSFLNCSGVSTPRHGVPPGQNTEVQP